MYKKEKKLYINHGKKWDVYIKYLITYSSHDGMNIIKCCEKSIKYNCVILKRESRRIKLFGWYLYFNKLYLGEVIEIKFSIGSDKE